MSFTTDFQLFLGAYYFHTQEYPLEEHQAEIMQNSLLDLNDSMSYVADHLEYITFSTFGKYNNCTVYEQEPFYQPKQSLYHLTCLDRNREDMRASKFCQCLWAYKENFERKVDFMYAFWLSE